MSRELAVLSLREIIIRALGAVERGAFDEACDYSDGNVSPVGWDLEFVQMSRDEQADWLISLFSALTNDEVESIDEVLEGIHG